MKPTQRTRLIRPLWILLVIGLSYVIPLQDCFGYEYEGERIIASSDPMPVKGSSYFTIPRVKWSGDIKKTVVEYLMVVRSEDQWERGYFF